LSLWLWLITVRVSVYPLYGVYCLFSALNHNKDIKFVQRRDCLLTLIRNV